MICVVRQTSYCSKNGFAFVYHFTVDAKTWNQAVKYAKEWNHKDKTHIKKWYLVDSFWCDAKNDSKEYEYMYKIEQKGIK